jgi:hypothetical protein
LDKGARHRAHDAQEEAEKQHDIDATAIRLLIITREEILVYFNDK